LENHNEWSTWLINSYSSEDYGGITIHSWGNSYEGHLADRFSPPHLNSIGNAMPIAIADGELFIAHSVEDIKSMIDATQDQVKSLADLPEYRLVSNAMRELGTLCVIIVDEALIRDILAYNDPITEPKIKNFQTVGMGPGRDETGEYMALVLVYENHEDAEEGVKLLEQKVEVFNQICTSVFPKKTAEIYNTEISVENEVLIAKLYNNHEGLWSWWFFDRWWAMYLGS
jgi:hypothetical protein